MKNPQIRNGTEAVVRPEKANALTGGNQPFVLATLAMAYAEARRFADAREAVQSALGLAASGDTLSAWQAQLRLYESNQPSREVFHEPAAAGAPLMTFNDA